MSTHPAAPALPPPRDFSPLAFTPLPEQPLAAQDYSGMSIPEVVAHTMNVYAQALKALVDLKMDHAVAKENAARLWRAELPELTDRRSVVAYIACVAWGQKMRLLEPAEIKVMIFMAQTQLTVLKQCPPSSSASVPTLTGAAEPASGMLFPPAPQTSMEPGGRK